MVTDTVVEQVLQARARGEAVAAVVRAYGLDRKTVRAWVRRGGYVPRATRAVRSCLAPYKDWLARRAAEVDDNATVLFRELKERGFPGSVIIVRRAVVPLRTTAAPPAATVRYETAPGAQAQVDFGQTRVWIADTQEVAQLFVRTLGFSRRCFAVAFRRQRLREWLAGHELAFQHFGGVTDTVLVDNAKAMVLTHTRETLAFHPTYADFCGYYGVRPVACAPYRPQTADFGRSRSPISGEADHLFRCKPITRFGPSRSPVSAEADQGDDVGRRRSPPALLLRDFHPGARQCQQSDFPCATCSRPSASRTTRAGASSRSRARSGCPRAP